MNSRIFCFLALNVLISSITEGKSQESDFDWSLYDYVVLLPSDDQYSLTFTQNDETLLSQRVSDIFGVEAIINETFEKERQTKSDGTRKPVQLLTVNEKESDAWLKAKNSSVCFLMTEVTIERREYDVTELMFDVSMIWRFFDIREKYSRPLRTLTERESIRLDLTDGALVNLSETVEELGQALRNKVRREWYYEDYDPSLSRVIFGELFGKGFDEMFAEANYIEPAKEQTILDIYAEAEITEAEVRADLSNGADSPIEGIWKTYKQGTASRCGTERFAILEIDDFRWKAVVLPELGGDLSGSAWKAGDVRAIFESTADPYVFACDWIETRYDNEYLIRKYGPEKGVLETFVAVDEGQLVVQYEDINAECVYIKMFPTEPVKLNPAPTNEGDDTLLGTGSCVLIDSECQLFATNAHVVEGSSRLTVNYSGNSFDAKVVAIDEENDLCILRTTDFNQSIKPAEVYSRGVLGQDVTAVGYPLVSAMGEDVKLTKGIISALSFLKNPTMYQIDCPITNGNSGGGLFNTQTGQLLGITSAGWRPDDNTENVNGAVKSFMILNLLSTISDCQMSDSIQAAGSLEEAVRTVGIVRAYSPK